MGLQLTLAKENNRLYHDFTGAYWSADDITYTTSVVRFTLHCYPSREAKYKHNNNMPASTLPIGSASPNIYFTILYSWETYVMITDIFPTGIPLSEDEQKTAIYNWIKSYTGLPFVDVLENNTETQTAE